MSNSGRRGKAKKIRAKLRAPSQRVPAPTVSDASEPYVDPVAAALTATPEPTDVRTLLAVEPVAAAAPATATARGGRALETIDDTSVPPVGDLDVRHLDSKFFDGAFFTATRISDSEWHLHPDLHSDPEFSDPHRWKWTASAAKRRAELAKYVVGVVSIASAMCVAALIRGAVPRSDGDLAAPVVAHRPSVVQVDTDLPPPATAAAARPAATPITPRPAAPQSGSAPASESAARPDGGPSSALPPSTAR